MGVRSRLYLCGLALLDILRFETRVMNHKDRPYVCDRAGG
jgi:hypothetical protein